MMTFSVYVCVWGGGACRISVLLFLCLILGAGSSGYGTDGLRDWVCRRTALGPTEARPRQQCACNVNLRRVRVTVVAVNKQ